MSNDNWETPISLIKSVEAYLKMRIALDVCATEKNAKCSKYFTIRDNALLDVVKWKHDDVNGFVFMNPPYSNPTQWVRKAYLTAQNEGMIVVGLLKDDRSTRWYQDWVENKAQIMLLPTKRISFVSNETGTPKRGSNFASIIPIWLPTPVKETQYVRINVSS